MTDSAVEKLGKMSDAEFAALDLYPDFDELRHPARGAAAAAPFAISQERRKPMANNVQAYAKLADDTAAQITGSYQEWTAFLTTAARLYKYPYSEQLMIYARRRSPPCWSAAMK